MLISSLYKDLALMNIKISNDRFQHSEFTLCLTEEREKFDGNWKVLPPPWNLLPFFFFFFLLSALTGLFECWSLHASLFVESEYGHMKDTNISQYECFGNKIPKSLYLLPKMQSIYQKKSIKLLYNFLFIWKILK